MAAPCGDNIIVLRYRRGARGGITTKVLWINPTLPGNYEFTVDLTPQNYNAASGEPDYYFSKIITSKGLEISAPYDKYSKYRNTATYKLTAVPQRPPNGNQEHYYIDVEFAADLLNPQTAVYLSDSCEYAPYVKYTYDAKRYPFKSNDDTFVVSIKEINPDYVFKHFEVRYESYFLGLTWLTDDIEIITSQTFTCYNTSRIITVYPILMKNTNPSSCSPSTYYITMAKTPADHIPLSGTKLYPVMGMGLGSTSVNMFGCGFISTGTGTVEIQKRCYDNSLRSYKPPVNFGLIYFMSSATYNHDPALNDAKELVAKVTINSGCIYMPFTTYIADASGIKYRIDIIHKDTKNIKSWKIMGIQGIANSIENPVFIESWPCNNLMLRLDRVDNFSYKYNGNTATIISITGKPDTTWACKDDSVFAAELVNYVRFDNIYQNTVITITGL